MALYQAPTYRRKSVRRSYTPNAPTAPQTPQQPYRPAPNPPATGPPRTAPTQAPNPGAPAHPPAPAKPPPKPYGGVPRITLPTSQASRIAADRAWALAQSSLGRQQYENALGYGDLNLINTLAKLGYGPAMGTAPETGALANIARQLGLQQRNIGEARNQGNTFFSGLHLRDVGLAQDEASRAKSKAYQSYLDARSRLNEALISARNAHSDAYGQAAAEELQYTQEQDPQAVGPTTKPAGKKQGAAGGGKPRKSKAKHHRRRRSRGGSVTWRRTSRRSPSKDKLKDNRRNG